MTSNRLGLTDAELASLASVAGREVDELATELARRPWALQDLLADPAIVAAAMTPTSPLEAPSPFVLFAVLCRAAADDLNEREHVDDFVGPRTRLPVFDVEPLREFVDSPSRVIFVARLLTSMIEPTLTMVPAPFDDPFELLDWFDAVDDGHRAVLLRRLGDLALFVAGVQADAHADESLDLRRTMKVARSLEIGVDEVVELLDPGSPTAGLDLLEALGARWYQAARSDQHRIPPVVGDVAARMHSARRFLTHLSDHFLTIYTPEWPIAA